MKSAIIYFGEYQIVILFIMIRVHREEGARS